jgi:hypothetical protein
VGGNFCVPKHPTWRLVVKEGGLEEKPLAMPEDKEIFPILESCWRELQRLHQSAAQLKSACATNEQFLTGGQSGAFSTPAVADSNSPELYSQSCRQKAEQTRELAHRVTVAKAKPRLLEIADTYDGLQD